MIKNYKITEAKFLSRKGRTISPTKIREGYVVRVGGVIKKHHKKIFVNVEVKKEDGDFYLQYGDLVQIEPAV